MAIGADHIQFLAMLQVTLDRRRSRVIRECLDMGDHIINSRFISQGRHHADHHSTDSIVLMCSTQAVLVAHDLALQVPVGLAGEFRTVHCRIAFALRPVARSTNRELRCANSSITGRLRINFGKRWLLGKPLVEVVLILYDHCAAHGVMANTT